MAPCWMCVTSERESEVVELSISIMLLSHPHKSVVSASMNVVGGVDDEKRGFLTVTASALQTQLTCSVQSDSHTSKSHIQNSTLQQALQMLEEKSEATH
ncbi:hypothetical protein BLNAU_17126 [Blattamonas nauphoetae]|uniref:Uncharacterized protein n=1 Tax=Blattamonas nauphoetae TaxID=2049346 RepID=A0ABQ9X7P8_9EUKA|nr:hypothetical protein BLNAU_17126 [Blattamonas nauphoetae]